MTASDSKISRFISELHRRRVFATAGIYIVGAWLVMQGGDVFFSGWGIPDRGINVLLIAAISGFPLALVFGWFFNITRHGIRRTLRAGPDEAAVSRPLKGGDYVVLAALLLASGVIVTRATQDILAMRGAVQQSVVAEKLPNSIAVLPFANMSSDPENEYFCDGISEEILNRLARYAEINVIGRTSSWQFKGAGNSIRDMTDLLGVNHLLRGSVQKAGDQLRISAQLVDDAGTQVWSETFDRKLADVFAIQSQIAELVATTVAPKIVLQPGVVYKPDIVAYDHFLRGREFLHERDKTSALGELKKAVSIDPGFAEAYAELAIAMLIVSQRKTDMEQAGEAIDTALTLSPGMPRALAAKGLLLTSSDYAEAEAALRQALEQEPHMVDAMNWLAGALYSQGKQTEAYALYYRAHGYDPLHPAITANLATFMKEKGDLAGAEKVLLPLLEVPDPSFYVFSALRYFYIETGQLVKMNRIERLQALKGRSVYLGLALSYAFFGMWEQADYWIDRSILEFPDFQYIAAYPSMVDKWRGRYANALKVLKSSVASSGTDTADLLWYQPHYGTTLALAGEYRAAIEVLQPYVENRQLTTDDEFEFEMRQDLAFAYLRTGEHSRAKALLESMEAKIETEAAGRKDNLLFELNPWIYSRARNAALMGEVELALERLRKAIDAGWRAYYFVQHDPRWDALKDDPRYQAMMAEVRADVDRQREVVVKLDAEQDLPALVDEARAETIATAR